MTDESGWFCGKLLADMGATVIGWKHLVGDLLPFMPIVPKAILLWISDDRHIALMTGILFLLSWMPMVKRC
jgi:crotonobetainyl-CoA:carnitine CoA-transferase CaiB-like acyl-CoA transferase